VGPSKGYQIYLIDPFHYEKSKLREFKETEFSDHLVLGFDQILDSVDYLLVNYLQPDSGQAQAEVRTKGATNFMFDFACAVDGLYYIGICQKTLDRGPYKNLRQAEAFETGEEYKRCNFFVSRYSDDTYLGGEGSSYKISWSKIYLKAGDRHMLFVNFDQDPGDFMVWGQGQSMLAFIPRQMKNVEVALI
jgi:hypothetical protein